MHRPARGFTLIETLVALTLLGVGVAAWVSTSTLAVRIAGAAARESTAHHRARSRASHLAGVPCSEAVMGSAPPESWTIQQLPNDVRLIRVAVRYLDEREERKAVYDIVATC